MSYFLGVDGGTSRMEAVIVDAAGRRLGWGISGPINGGGGGDHPQARQHVLACITAALGQAGVAGAAIAGSCLYMSGWNAGRTEEARQWLAPLGVGGWLQVGEDGPGAWAAAGCPDPCVFVLLGTYSGVGGFRDGTYVPFALNDCDLDFDTQLQAEGHVIGSKALAAAIMGERCPTALLPALAAHLQVDGVRGLLAWAAAHEGRRERAALCQLAAEVARAGDATARAIFTAAGQGAARAVALAARWQGTTAGVSVVLAGNVWQAGELIGAPFAQTLAELLPGAAIVGPVHQAEGCALLARRRQE